MRMIEEPTIVTNPDILGETYVPPDIPARLAQIEELRSCLAPALKGEQPIALRTFSEYMNKLIELDLVEWDRALVRGKVRVFKVSD